MTNLFTMSLRRLLPMAAAVLAGGQLFAATYYVSPEGAGTKDGSSADNAFGVEEFITQAANNANGDIYYFAGGVYKPSTTVIFKTATGASLYGNSTGERTIFSGDKNDNNNPDSGDAGRLIRFQANTVNGNSANAIVIENIDFTCVYVENGTADATFGGLMVDNSGDVKVNNCNFYGTWSQGSQGGAACFLYRSTVTFTDCVFRNNSANYRGAAIRLSSNSSAKGVTTFVNCVFKNNTNYHNLGIIFAAYAKEVNLINCTVSGNKSNGTENAAVIFMNPKGDYPNKLTIVNSTIAGNTPSQIGFNGKGANLRIANSIIAGDEGSTAIEFNSAEEFANVVSGGYNYAGPVNVGEFWQPTDNHGEDCTYMDIFGQNKITSANIIVPNKYYDGASAEQITQAVAGWELPAGLDLTEDITGNPRETGSMPGSYAIVESDISSIPTSVIDAFSSRSAYVVREADGIFRIEGAVETLEAYSVSGAKMAHAAGKTIDLRSLPKGLYILKAGKNTFKVLR